MIKATFTKGDDFGENECGNYTAGIHVETDSFWGNRIEIYGETVEEAQELRDRALLCLVEDEMMERERERVRKIP